MVSHNKIRNFSIIAHIDHGKSTLADRFIEMAGLMDDRTKKNQVLDSLDIERERGITVKAQTVSIQYKAHDGETYNLTLIDTPGHVDFSYEVSRALMACEAVLLIVDASQGIEAQTLAHYYSALEQNLTIIPVLNKIDLPTADIEKVLDQIENELAIEREKAILISAKTGVGVEDLLEAIVKQCPPPDDSKANNPLKALIYDAYYDDYRGVVALVRIFEGSLKKGNAIRFFQVPDLFTVEEVGVFRLTREPASTLYSGQVGYMIAGIRNLEQIKIGDTITDLENPTKEALPGFRDSKSFVFAGIFPLDVGAYQKLKESLQKLKLNDSALTFTPESSQALGAGFRCGFLGLLHFEIIQERLQREFDLDVVVSTPGVEYEVHLNNKEVLNIASPTLFPNVTKIDHILEPYVKMVIYSPQEYLGNIFALCQEKRGIQEKMKYIDTKRLELIYSMPLAEIIYDFHDKLKSISRGYATFDYELSDYKPTKIVKVDILVNGKQVDALSFLCFHESAQSRGKIIVEKLKENISRHMFQIPIQAAIGGKVIARETISALKKDVTAKCYGGDITRKKKLLAKQKEGKKRMQVIGNVEIPQEAFINVFKGDMDSPSS
jgi:GTP-binding protein LepA